MHDAYMSYWSAGYQKIPSENVLLMTKIANYFAALHFNNVYLITDSKSSHFFKKMHWTNISTELDMLDPSLGGIWSLGKILSYKIAAERNSPFIHIDYDVILWNGIPEKIKHSEIFAQNDEPNAYQSYEIDLFLKNCPYTSHIKHIAQNSASNMGIFGGTNNNFIFSYATDALDLATNKQNYNFWTQFKGFDHTWNMATIVEQYFMVTMSHIMSQQITHLFDNGWPTKDDAKKQNYTHFMGDKDSTLIVNKLHNIANQYGISLKI